MTKEKRAAQKQAAQRRYYLRHKVALLYRRRRNYSEHKGEYLARARQQYERLKQDEASKIIIDVGTKTCSVCRLVKPIDQFSRSISCKDGRRGQCNPCRVAKEHDRWLECGEEGKAHKRLAYKERAPIIRERAKRYRQAHPEQQRQHHERYYKQNRAKVLAKTKIAQQKKASWYSAYNRQYRRDHLARRRFLAARWRFHNPDRVAANQKARRTDECTFEQWEALLRRYGHRCLACGKHESEVFRGALTQDHIVPIIKGGGNEIGNLQPLCLPCNCKKGKKIIDYRPQ